VAHTARVVEPQHLEYLFHLNLHNTLVWSRHMKLEYFHSRLLPFYINEETFDKEFVSWTSVKCNPRKSSMHYLLPPELLKKKG
jgi:hypothetical protein